MLKEFKIQDNSTPANLCSKLNGAEKFSVHYCPIDYGLSKFSTNSASDVIVSKFSSSVTLK